MKPAIKDTPLTSQIAKEENVKIEWIVGPHKVTAKTKLKYKPNPKRKNSAAWLRYEQYQTAKTFGEYQNLNKDKQSIPDLKHDFSKHFVEIIT